MIGVVALAVLAAVSVSPGALAAPAAPAVRGEPTVSESTEPIRVWVDLDLPPLASVAHSDAAARDALRAAALSFGALEVDRRTTTRALKLRVENLSGSSKRFTITPSFRFASDENSSR